MEYRNGLLGAIILQKRGTKKKEEETIHDEEPQKAIEEDRSRIAQERSRMLKEHAIKLRALLPPCCPDN